MRQQLRLCLRAAAASLLSALTVSSQIVSPSNNTAQRDLIANGTTFNLTITPQMIPLSLSLDGLTTKATQQKDPISGNLYLTTDQTVNTLLTGQIAFLPCDTAAFSDGYLDASATTALAIARRPNAIVLYSSTADHCMYNGSANTTYDMVYTAFGTGQTVFERMLNTTNPTTYPANITNTSPIFISLTGNTTINSTIANGSPDNPYNQGNGTPTTAVAMIVLYSITGLITALFLVIIISGAVRAHRHPERYGPRALARFGRPPQSRARGIARAVLDSIPIVKFDEQGAPKPETATSEGIEMTRSPGSEQVARSAPQTQDVERQQAITSREASSSTGAASRPQPEPSTAVAESSPSGAIAPPTTPEITPAVPSSSTTTGPTQPSSSSSTSPPSDPQTPATVAATEPPGKLTCSICTEDFIKGEDIRLLPCDHRFHPDCVDPWLLNVSGTCPLCRIDLRPVEDAQGDPVVDIPDVPRGTFAEDRSVPLLGRRRGGESSLAVRASDANRASGSAAAAELSPGTPRGMEFGGLAAASAARSATLPPDPELGGPAEGSGRRRLSRYLDWTGIVNADRSERIAFLRRLREQRRGAAAAGQQGGGVVDSFGGLAPVSALTPNGGEGVGNRLSAAGASRGENRRSGRLSGLFRSGRGGPSEGAAEETAAEPADGQAETITGTGR